ncbi:MAG: cytidine deaminase [Candidatus Cloacimonetes bacterium]|nr:cytidine deaminase [Candidatus Cloacimonadota bacterium]
MEETKLMKIAKAAAKNAYAPYSKVQLGAAIKAKSGKIYTGVNVENSSYGLTNCAERTAIFKAISEGESEFEELAIYVDSDTFFTPCGACRQVIAEFCDNLKIVVFSNNDKLETSIEELLPKRFKL